MQISLTIVQFSKKLFSQTCKRNLIKRKYVFRQLLHRGKKDWALLCKGAFNNYVHRILPFFTPPLRGQFLYLEHGQKQTFFDPLPPHLVHVVIECPLKGDDSVLLIWLMRISFFDNYVEKGTQYFTDPVFYYYFQIFNRLKKEILK